MTSNDSQSVPPQQPPQPSSFPGLKADLQRLLGGAHSVEPGTAFGMELVSDTPETLAAHSGDKWFASHAPACVVFAQTTEQVSRVLAFAHKRGIPVTARGGGVGYVGGCVPIQGGIVLSLARMNRIKEISLADGLAVVESGVLTGDLQAAAREMGLFYPPDPASLKECTLGGNIATNAGGPRCLKYGVTRAYLTGLEVVLANGEVLRTGGRTLKNKTGFDLIGLFTGSEGLLGVVTEATVRLLPHPPARAALSASFEKFSQAAEAVQRILASGFLPSALEVADAFTLQAARQFLGEKAAPKGNGHLLVEVDGQAEAIAGELRALSVLLKTCGAVELQQADTEAACEALWERRRQFSQSLRSLEKDGVVKLNEDIVVPRGRLVELTEFAAELGARYGFPVACFGHAGDGNIHTNLMVRHPDHPEMKPQVERALDELFARVLSWGGAITGEHGIGLAKRRWWGGAVSPVSHRIHEALKTALDPKGILNPGKFVGSH